MRELTPELRAFSDLARAAQGSHEVGDLLQRICMSVVETFEFERSSINRYLAETGEIERIASYGLPDEALAVTRRRIDDVPLLRRVLQTERAVFVEDARSEPSIPAEVVDAFGIRSVVAVPLITGGRPLGFLGADRGGRPFSLDERELDLITTMGTLAAVFLEKALVHEELHQLDQLKTQFVALASHELRTPAAVIHGIASTLHLRGEKIAGPQRKELRRTLYEQTDRMRRLVEQLLDLSRLEAKGVTIDPKPLWVRSRVEELVVMVAGERAADVAVDVPSDLETFADGDVFDRIVSNLIVNAIRYGEAPIRVSAEQPDRYLRLTVEDGGGGVAPEFIPHLFERFTRSKSSELQLGGAGLGLAIAQSYAQAHGGEILYEPAEPHGARFRLMLLAAPNSL